MEKININLPYEIRFIIYIFSLLLLFSADLIYLKIRKKPAGTGEITAENHHKLFRGFSLPLVLNCIIVALCLMGFNRLLTETPVIISTYPAENTAITSYNLPMKFEFSAPVDFSRLKINMSPVSSGTWEYHRYIDFLPFGRLVTFKPAVNYPPDEKIMVYLTDISKPLSGIYGSEYLVNFKSQPATEIKSSDPGQNQTEVPVNTELSFALNNNISGFTKWDAEIHPETAFKITEKNNRLIIRFSENLLQGTTYSAELLQTPVKINLTTQEKLNEGAKTIAAKLIFTTVKPPLISTFSPDGTVNPDKPVSIDFDQTMDKTDIESKIEIIPRVTGKYVWSTDGKNLRFLPDKWPLNTKIRFILKRNLKTAAGGLAGQDTEYTFKTIGPAYIIGTDPENNMDNFPTDRDISVTFDQMVDHKSAETNFSVYPETPGTFSWDNQTMIYHPKEPLLYNTGYNVRIKPGVKSILATDSEAEHKISFKTAPETFSIDVPYFPQNELFTCNIAASRMILAFRGIQLTEKDLKNKIGYAGTRGNGDPHRGYTENYGTYWEPIAKMTTVYRPSRLYTNWNLSDLIKEVAKGNPVMIWGQNGWSDPHELSWTNPDGTRIFAINGMHSSVVRGYKGPQSHPTAIIINDPWRGVTTLPTAEFTRRWSFFGAALIVD
jgi:uncharacterized protein YvpB